MGGKKHSRNLISSYFLRECDFDILLLIYSYCASQVNWYRLVRRVTGLLTARLRNRMSILSSEKSFFLSLQADSGAHSASRSIGRSDILPWGKAAGS
jgi:hypothetical protein